MRAMKLDVWMVQVCAMALLLASCLMNVFPLI